jgi:hypothetical protein
VPVIRNNGNSFGDRLAEHTYELDNRKEITRIQPRLVTTASLKKAHILPYSYIINEKTLSAFDDSMAQETELLYVVTVVIFILICDLIMAWSGSRRTAILPNS